jgi:hypothetical protein
MEKTGSGSTLSANCPPDSHNFPDLEAPSSGNKSTPKRYIRNAEAVAIIASQHP